MHLCLQQLIPRGVGAGPAKGALKYFLHTKPCQEQRGGQPFFVRDTKLSRVHLEDAFCGMGGPPLHPTAASLRFLPQHNAPKAARGVRRSPGGAFQWCKMPRQQGVQAHGQPLLQAWLFLHPSALGRCSTLKALFKGSSVILPLARTTGQYSAVLGCFSGQNLCLLLLLSFS